MGGEMKKFEDMFQLSDADREFLKRENSSDCCCNDCPLNIVTPCNDLVGISYKNGCNTIRSEAIRLDDEYRRKNMKSEILSQDEFEETLSSITIPNCSYSSGMLRCSHTAALNKIAELESRLEKYEPADTRDEAWVKVCEEAKRIKDKGRDVKIEEFVEYFSVASIPGISEARFYFRTGDDK